MCYSQNRLDSLTAIIIVYISSYFNVEDVDLADEANYEMFDHDDDNSLEPEADLERLDSDEFRFFLLFLYKISNLRDTPKKTRLFRIDL
jgi:hypothetical protein